MNKKKIKRVLAIIPICINLLIFVSLLSFLIVKFFINIFTNCTNEALITLGIFAFAFWLIWGLNYLGSQDF